MAKKLEARVEDHVAALRAEHDRRETRTAKLTAEVRALEREKIELLKKLEERTKAKTAELHGARAAQSRAGDALNELRRLVPHELLATETDTAVEERRLEMGQREVRVRLASARDELARVLHHVGKDDREALAEPQSVLVAAEADEANLLAAQKEAREKAAEAVAAIRAYVDGLQVEAQHALAALAP